mmetsp:Transcript_28125/g.38883  ORF Transcript_28125/g.38883 Transcript_28125/m.38883 type:complete len:141 (+) Transcript_28125:111-533(+)|eukprot:CAMPEP_0196584778 /NCGR_PEP_ID=MMETSP1081-20130531/48440_1 /TAXON_ID=36882 /ORGANISM="Pyramimonas amylifera, Strain CCMP720" /LENGTH=140 /DNA_ID=CAMNT_0041906117 /DNA_START=110 /DNA_END=532 /DNA_ORIENTATION=-
MSTTAADVVVVKTDEGDSIEMETVGFTDRRDKDEDRRNDGNVYKGLLSNKEYNKRKAKVEETMDMQAYRFRKANEIIAKDDAKRQEDDEARKERMERKRAALQAELRSPSDSKKESKRSSSKKKIKVVSTLSFQDDEQDQ